MKKLREVLEELDGKFVKVGPATNFTFIGLCDYICREYLEFIEPGSLDCEVKEVYDSEFGDVKIVIYDSENRGSFWTLKEFMKSTEWYVYEKMREGTFDPSITMMKLQEKHRKVLHSHGYKARLYKLNAETTKQYVFIHAHTFELLYLPKPKEQKEEQS